jgi:hypothetical protein
VTTPSPARAARLRRARLGAQLLAAPSRPDSADPADPVATVEHLLAVQAQDDRGFRLALRSRHGARHAAVVDAALADRRLIVTWALRGTLHLVRPEDAAWLLPLTTPQLATGNRRRLAEEGVTPRQTVRGIDAVTAALADGPKTRAELRAALDAARVPSGGQAFVHLMLAATIAGHVARGPVVGRELAWVGVAQWLDDTTAVVGRDEALARLAHRYLQGHAPARPEDLAKWAGITIGDARSAFAALGDSVVPWPDDPVLIAPAERVDRPLPRLPAPRLLGPFDPLLHGWQDRVLFTGDHQGVVTTNGIFRPVALVDGRVVGTWGLASGTVTIRLLEPVGDLVRNRLVVDAARVLEYLALPPREAVVVGE